MTLILGRRADKERSLALVTQVIEQFVFPGIGPNDIARVAQHITWLRQQTDDLKVNARFETFPEARITRIVLDLSFVPSIKPFKVKQ